MVGFQFHFNRWRGVEKIVDRKNDNIHPSIHTYIPTYIHSSAQTKWKNRTFWPLEFLAKPSRAKIQPNWILQFGTLIETMGSVVFIWGLFEVELAARPITILSPCFPLDKVKISVSNLHFAFYFQILTSLWIITVNLNLETVSARAVSKIILN